MPTAACSWAMARAWPARRRCSPRAACRPPAASWTWPSSATASCRWSWPTARPITPQITVPANATGITIGENGIVSAMVGNATTPTELGQLTMATFVNPTGLLAIGDNLYQQTQSSGEPAEGNPGEDGRGKLKQGAL